MSSPDNPRPIRRRVALASLGALAGLVAVRRWTADAPAPEAPPPLGFDELLDHVLPLAERAAAEGAAGEPAYLRALAGLAARTGWEPARPFDPGARVEILLERRPVVFTLFHLERGAALPPHDHHGYCALLKVLSGHPVIHEYKLNHPAPEDRSGRLEVIRTARRTLAPGRLAAAGSHHAPIHSIESPHDDTQLVDIFTLHSTPASRLVHLEGDEDAPRRQGRWGALM